MDRLTHVVAVMFLRACPWVEPVIAWLVNVTILFSQFINVVFHAGSPYEMLSSRAWRQRQYSTYWKAWQVFPDHYSPLGFWRFPHMTHCESCYWAEAGRIKQNAFRSPEQPDFRKWYR